MKYKDVKVKRKGMWMIITAPEHTDYELFICYDSMSKNAAVNEFIMDVRKQEESKIYK